jgi:predicted PurR-regulated permease PerM
VKKFANLRSYMIVATVTGLFVGVLVYFGTRFEDTAIAWGLGAFILALVTIATLDLSYKPDDSDPNLPKLR